MSEKSAKAARKAGAKPILLAGWFVTYHVFTRYIKVTFFQGASLRPVPAGAGKDKDSRWVDIYQGELEEDQMATWIRQAAALPAGVGSDELSPPR